MSFKRTHHRTSFVSAGRRAPSPVQSLFYAVDTGMSIGFGAVAEQRLTTKVFTICHVLLGASAVGGAIALFAESVVSAQGGLASCEHSAGLRGWPDPLMSKGCLTLAARGAAA